MPRRVVPDQLVGAAEIAQRLGVKRSTVVHDWARRHPDFPRPIARLVMGHVWHWPEVESWALRTKRLKA